MQVLALFLGLIQSRIVFPEAHQDAVHRDASNFESPDLSYVRHASVNRYNLRHLVTQINDDAIHAQFRHDHWQLRWLKGEFADTECLEGYLRDRLALLLSLVNQVIVVCGHRE